MENRGQMPRKKEVGSKKSRKSSKKAKKGSQRLFYLPFIVGLISLFIGFYLILSSGATKPSTFYSRTKPCYAYNQNDEPVAWVNVTLSTNTSIPKCHFPINVTLSVRGLYVPPGNWTYAFLQGATASFPNKEPLDWEHDPKEVIVLQSNDNFAWFGSRIMNYTFEGDWEIYLHVLQENWYVINCIPPNPLGEPMKIYTIPSAVHITSTESIVQIDALQESANSRSFWSGIAFVITGLGSLVTAILKRQKLNP
jgi:hypothetical protein